jgi:hypothetical protein
MTIGLTFAFEKGDAEGKYVRGWASVVSANGKPVTDWDGDRIEIEELRKAAHRFVLDARVAKAMHKGETIGDVVESLIVDDQIARALGITDPRRGWFIGMRVNDAAIAKRVRDGEAASP